MQSSLLLSHDRLSRPGAARFPPLRAQVRKTPPRAQATAASLFTTSGASAPTELQSNLVGAGQTLHNWRRRGYSARP